MIAPTPSDIGRRVYYAHPIVRKGAKHYGMITGIEGNCAWVKYDSDDYGDAGPLRTGLEGLEWAS